jgi:hypothetical protein
VSYLNEPKNHHYVPEVNQKNFADENRCVQTYYKHEQEKGVTKERIKDILYEEYFHTYIDEQNERNNDFENYLNKIETLYGNALQGGLHEEIRNNNSLSKNQEEALINFVVYQYARTPKKRKSIANNLEKIVSHILESDGQKPIYESIGIQSKLEQQLMYEFVHSKWSKINWITGLAEKAFKWINKKNISFLLAPKDSQFITSDDPAFFLENSHFVIPLSSDICMITGLKGDKYASGTISKEEVNYINRATALNASNILVAKDKSILEEIVAKLSL